MKVLTDFETQEVNGAGINIGKLVGGIVIGAVGGLLRGIPGGPLVMIGSAIAGAGIGAFGVAVNDAIEINQKLTPSGMIEV